MKFLDLSGTENYIGDTGGADLLKCLDKLKELQISESKMSTEVKEKITEKARDLSVKVKFLRM